MAINKIVLNTDNGEQVLVDLTDDTVVADALVVGHTAHGADGERIEGENPYALEATDTEVQNQTNLIEQIQTALIGKAAGSGGFVPTGTKQIKTNGTHDVAAYAYAEVAVPSETPTPVTQATPVISVSPSGKITATATQDEGYVEGGTKTATIQLATKGATTITPTASVQTAVTAGTYVTGDIKVAAVSGGGGGDSAPQWRNINTLYATIDANTGIIDYRIEYGADMTAILIRQVEDRVFSYIAKLGNTFTSNNYMWIEYGSNAIVIGFDYSEIAGKTVEYIVI